MMSNKAWQKGVTDCLFGNYWLVIEEGNYKFQHALSPQIRARAGSVGIAHVMCASTSLFTFTIYSLSLFFVVVGVEG